MPYTQTRPGGVVAIGLVLAAVLQTPPAYNEQLRPQFHFSPAASFTNDPNGLVYYKGRYHLFYQQRVFTGPTGLSCCDWGHAISTDLVRWEQRPVAIHRVPASATVPEEAIFSGSAVVDWANSSGFGTTANPPLVAIYTGSRPGLQTQQLAYSNDAGDTWQIYSGNPVLDIQSGSFRDPKVFWFEPLKRWTMVIYSSTGTRFYTSPNLKEWTHRSTFGTGFECPDFFPLALDGNPRNQKWVLFEANGSYWVGDFDGAAFTADAAPGGRLDHGTNYYAAQTFSDTPDRRILISWISTGFMRRGIWTELPWMGAMTVARELSLKTIDGRPQVVAAPVAEVASLRGEGVDIPAITVGPDRAAPIGQIQQGDQLDIEMTLDPQSAVDSGLKVLAGGGLHTTIGYDARTNEVYIDRSRSGRQDGLAGNGSTGRVALPAAAKGKPIRLRILVDRSTIEVYADGGSRVLSSNVIPLVNTTTTSPGDAGSRILRVQSTAGFNAGQALQVNADANGARSGVERHTIADVGSGAIKTTLAAAVAPGDTNLKVADITNFAAGRTITVGSDSTAELLTVGEVGTAAAAPTRLLIDAASGATNIKVASVMGLTSGAILVVGSGDERETVAVAAGGAGTAGRATTVAARVAAGASTLKVASLFGAAVGAPIAIGTRGSGIETRTIVGPVDGSGRLAATAGPEGTGVTLSASLSNGYDTGAQVRFLGTGITLASPLSKPHREADVVRSLGSGVRVTAPSTRAHAEEQSVADPGTGLTLTAPLTSSWPAGTPVATPLADGIEAFASGGTAQIISGRIWRMKSIWRR